MLILLWMLLETKHLMLCRFDSDGIKSAHLFLYQCIYIRKKRSVPVFQMIFAKQNATLLTYFLLEIHRAGATVPSITAIYNSNRL